MLKLTKIYAFWFARSRVRRQIKFDPKLKDFSSTQQVQLQMEEMRKQFQSEAQKKLSDILNDPSPKLGKRFAIDKKKLTQEIRKVYKQQMTVQNLNPHDDNDLDYLAEGKSHLNDQKAQIEFEEEFRKQLFRTKETKRLLQKKQKQVNNHLPGRQDGQYKKYEQAKMKLKNNRIKNMMNISRNNEQLQLLIESGLMNNPDNLKNLIEGMNNQQQKISAPFLPQGNGNELMVNSDEKGLEQRIQEMRDIGPIQMQEHEKVKQFISNWEQMNTADKKQCQQDLDLLTYIKQYEQKVFLQRYDAINFRFKGRVTFKSFKEKELISYIKNQQILPKDLLLIYSQNQHQLSKFNVPILTPSVVSNIYSKTSLYQFPETDSNNRINMLNDPLFVKLEKQTFMNLHKLNDDDYCSAVWSYAVNHEEQQGILKPNVADKVGFTVFEQLAFRMYNMSEQNLGLIMRSLSKMPITKIVQQVNMGQILDFIEKKLPHVQNTYTCESIFQFLMCVPANPQVSAIVLKNLAIYRDYQWQHKNSLSTFMYAAGFLIKTYSTLPQFTKVKKQITNILIKQQPNLHKQLLSKVSINNLPQFMTILGQTQASLVLPKMANLCKKLAVDNIKQQKQIIKQFNIPKLVQSCALLDLTKYQNSKKQKFALQKSTTNQSSSENMMRKLSLDLLLPFQPIPFNSSNYFVYHQIAKFTAHQIHNISSMVLAKTIESLSLVKYKNQSLYDQLAQKIMTRMDELEEGESRIGQNSVINQTLQMLAIINSFSLQKRNTPLLRQVISRLFNSSQYQKCLIKVSPNYLLRTLVGVVSIYPCSHFDSVQLQLNTSMQKIIQKLLLPLALSTKQNQIFIEEELAGLVYLCLMIGRSDFANQIKVILGGSNNVNRVQFKFILETAKLLQSLNVQSTAGKHELMDMGNWLRSQRQLQKKIDSQIKFNQMCIGSPMSYKEVYKGIEIKLKEQYGTVNVVCNRWRFEIENEKTVYFLATYDHLFTQTIVQQDSNQATANVGLFGIWKLYYKMYTKKGWKIKIICAFLEG